MNISHIRELLANRYTDVKEIGASLFKAHYSYMSRLVGIYFFDCSNKLLESSFDLEAYQDQLLAEEYYSLSGAIQWNFYLYFICDTNDYTSLDRGRIGEIESNKVYARKYVTTEKFLEDELSYQAEKWRSSKGDIPKDISIRWIEKLKEQNLDGVFMQKVHRTEVVKRYIEGNPIIEDLNQKDDYKQPSEVSRSSIKHIIKHIEIKDYRPCLTGGFDFGVSNLIEGVNGSGKTSLLEAIELWTCGQTFRNRKDKDDESSAKIGIQFSDGKPPVWNHRGDNGFYRDRDLCWYGNHYANGNRLCFSFNRFNFYDSDAATNLQKKSDKKNKSDEQSIDDAISSLILGETANIIEERLKALRISFEKEQASYEKEWNALRAEIKEAEDELRALGSTPEKEQATFDQFLTELEKLGWQGMIPRDENSSLNLFLQELAKVSAQIEECQSQLSWLPYFSFLTIHSERKRLADLIKKVEDLNQHIHEYKNLAEDKNKKIENISSELVKIDNLKLYLFDKDASKLSGLNKTISVRNKEKDCYSKVEKILENINLEKYLGLEESIADLESQKNKLLIKLQDKAKTLKQGIDEFEQRRGRIAKLIAEIRSKGSELISQNPNIENCPLCGAAYEIGELAKRIAEQQDKLEQSALVADHLAELSSTQIQLDTIRKEIDELRKIKNATSIILDTADCSSVLMGKAVESLSIIHESLVRVSKDLDELQTLKDHLASKGLIEEQYESLRQWFSETYSNVSLDYSYRHEFEAFRSKKENELSTLKSKLMDDEKKLSIYVKEKGSALREYFITIHSDETRESEIRKRSNQIEEVLKIYLSTSKRGDKLSS